MNNLIQQRDHISRVQGKLESVTCKEQVLCVGEHDPPAYEHYENRQFFGTTQEIDEFADELALLSPPLDSLLLLKGAYSPSPNTFCKPFQADVRRQRVCERSRRVYSRDRQTAFDRRSASACVLLRAAEGQYPEAP
jgi:hypothetical protein